MRTFLTILASVCFYYNGYSQQLYKQINYEYDAAGNRIARHTILSFNKKSNQDTTTTKDVVTLDSSNTQKQNTALLNKNAVVSIFPNPTADLVKLSIQGFNETNEAKLILSDAYGKEIIVNEKFNSSTIIDLTSYSSGVYFVYLIVNNQKHVYRINKI